MRVSQLLSRLVSRTNADHVLRRVRRAGLTIFCYHGVRADDDPVRHWLMVSASDFERHLQFVRRHYECLPLEDGVRLLKAGRIRHPVACITFDDGYRNNLTVAYPILATLGIPATIFLATGFIGTGRTLWTTRLGFALRRSLEADRTAPELVDVSIPMSADQAENFVRRLKELPTARRRQAVTQLNRALGDLEVPQAFSFMDWGEVEQLVADGLVTIGAHTVNHEIVARLSDADLATEIAGSQQAIARHLGHLTRLFAYPNGRAQDIDARSFPLLRRNGIEIAVTTIPGVNRCNAPSLALRRVVIGGSDSTETFRAKASGLEIGALMRHRRLLRAASPS